MSAWLWVGGAKEAGEAKRVDRKDWGRLGSSLGQEEHMLLIGRNF